MINITDVIYIIDEFSKAKSKSDSLKDNKEKILESYGNILTDHPEKDDHMKRFENLINLLVSDKLSKDQYKQFIGSTMTYFGAHIATTIVDKGCADLSDRQTDILIGYFRDSLITKHISSLGIYAVSQLLDKSAPMKCYELTKEAFEIEPDLAQSMNIEGYIYEGKSAEENITHECPFCGEAKEILPYFCSPQIRSQKIKNEFPPAKLWMKCNKCNNFYTYDFPLVRVEVINTPFTDKDSTAYIKNHFPMNTYSNIFRVINQYANGKDYLEIGIGTGEMMAAALEYGYNVQGVEICRQDCDTVSKVLGIEIACCDIVNFETDRKYDVIVMGDVFEHITKPVAVIEKVSKMLNDDGVLWLSTPNYNCAYARMEGFSHCMWHETDHYTYSSFETIEKILNDFGMETVYYAISERYLGSMELTIKKK